MTRDETEETGMRPEGQPGRGGSDGSGSEQWGLVRGHGGRLRKQEALDVIQTESPVAWLPFTLKTSCSSLRPIPPN